MEPTDLKSEREEMERLTAERNALMFRTYEAERLSFAQLAERFGVSRQRAQQIVARERARRRG